MTSYRFSESDDCFYALPLLPRPMQHVWTAYGVAAWRYVVACGNIREERQQCTVRIRGLVLAK